MNSSNETLNFSKICRVCCLEGSSMSVFKVNIHKKLMACATIQVWQNDGLPGQICKKCVAKLHIAFQFKKLCERSDLRLQHCRESGKYIENKHDAELTSEAEAEQQVLHDLESPPEEELEPRAPPEEPLQPPPPPNYSSYSDCVVPSISERNYDPIIGIGAHEVSMEHPQLVYNGSGVLASMSNVTLPMPGGYGLSTLGGSFTFGPSSSQLQSASNQMLSLDTLTGHQPSLRNHIQSYNLQQINPILEDKKELKNTAEEIDKKRNGKIHRKEKIMLDRNTFRCPICNKIFVSNGKLTRHMKTHSGDMPFKCKVCRKGFSHSGNFKVHMRMHTGERPFACRMCHRSCRQQQDLDKHMRTHTGERPHTCSTCQRAFTTSSNLIAHERIHSGEKPYVCSVCQKAFCQSNELTKHMRTHTGEKSHICPVCDKGFNGSSTLIVHMRIHTGERPYVCTICNKGFTQSSCLAVHARRHMAGRGFSCQRCPRSFASAPELRLHTAAHAPATLCCPAPGCLRRFSRPNDLVRHAKVHPPMRH